MADFSLDSLPSITTISATLPTAAANTESTSTKPVDAEEFNTPDHSDHSDIDDEKDHDVTTDDDDDENEHTIQPEAPALLGEDDQVKQNKHLYHMDSLHIHGQGYRWRQHFDPKLLDRFSTYLCTFIATNV